MKIDLKTYMEERDRQREQSLIPGPVITISRQHGCDAATLAIKLIHRIEELTGKKGKWKYLDRKVLEEAAKELHISTQKIRMAMDPGPEAIVEELLSSFTQHYVANTTILKTLEDVLDLYARKGNVVMIGRGGAVIARKIPNSLHIRLEAPMDYRAKDLSKRRKISLEEAKRIIEAVDKKRTIWIDQMKHGKVQEPLYDLVINRKRISDDRIVDIIIDLLLERKMIRIQEKSHIHRFVPSEYMRI